MPYSVSPRRNDQTRRPKPTKYSVTLTSNFFAGHMWPTSCRPIETISPTKKTTTPSV